MKWISNAVAALMASGLIAGLATGGTLDEPVGSAQAATDPAAMVRGQLAEYERLLGQNFLSDVPEIVDRLKAIGAESSIATWTQLAEEGNADACFLLGMSYNYGVGVDVDRPTHCNLERHPITSGDYHPLLPG